MRKINSSYKVHVSEIYNIETGWSSLNKKISIKNIYELFENNFVENISIIDKDSVNQKDYNYKSFVKEYCTLEKFYQLIVDDVLSEINLILGFNIDLNKISFSLESTSESWDGIYRKRYKSPNGEILNGYNIAIKMSTVRYLYNTENKYLFQRIKGVLYHEIGHFIHEYYFQNRNLNLIRKGCSVYAKTDFYEDFAEAFMDLIENSLNCKNYTDRDFQLLDYLNNIELI